MVAMAISTAVIGITMYFLVYQSRYSSGNVFTMKAQKLIYNVLMDIRLGLMQAGPCPNTQDSNGKIQYDPTSDRIVWDPTLSKLTINPSTINPSATTYELKGSTLTKNGRAVLGPEVETQEPGKTIIKQPVMAGTFKVEGFSLIYPVSDTDTKCRADITVSYSWKIGSNVDTGSVSLSVNVPEYESKITISPEPFRKLIVGTN
jgi:hypothetical protein